MRDPSTTATSLVPPMGRSRRASAAIVGLVAVLVTVGPAAAAAAAQDAPPPADPWIVADPTFEPLDGAPLEAQGIGEYRGNLRITRSPNGVAVVNHVTLDDYLRGISEVPTSWPIEAQKAQAIAARTYALHEVGRTATTAAYKQVGADLCATDACQVYAGLAKERRPGSEAWLYAVEQTKGQVITYKGSPIVAKYSSSNGGHTVSGGQPYLQARPDPDDAYSPLHRWQVRYPIGDVARAAGLAAEPTTLTRAGDDIVATYVDADGNPVEQRLPASEFRDRLNDGIRTPSGVPLPVPSIRFDAAAADGQVIIDGRGWGHGIGLSQYGALGKAIRGMKAPDILAAYYAGLRPAALPADRIANHVRVALAIDRREATVTSASGRFRIKDGDGRVLAHSATGSWSALPAPGGAVRLVPPADQAGLPSATLASVEPAAPVPGQALAAKVELHGPAAVTRIVLTTPGGAPRELDAAKLRLPGPVTIRLAAATTATTGSYRIDLEQDAGAGRTATSTVTIDVTPSATPTAAAGGTPPTEDLPATDHEAGLVGAAPGAGALKGFATVLFLAVAAAGGAWVGRRPRLQLH